jgi:membrane protein DedA with SNARE-associated domain
MSHTLAQAVAHYGYVAVFALIMLEDFGIPVPGETALVAASAAAASGKLSIWVVALAAIAGAILGDNIGYAIGHFGGRRLVVRLGSRFGLDAAKFAHAENTFKRYGDAVVVGSRFVEVLRQLNGVIAGTMGMPWPTFLRFNALGAVLWVGAWASIGYFAGHNMAAIEALFARFHWLALCLAAAALIAYLFVRRRNTLRAAAADEARPDHDIPAS